MSIILGTNGDDNLVGTASNDLIIGGKGDDTIDGGDGNDLIFGGKGDDTIDGGDGNDLIFGGKGDDTIDGGEGNDLIFGGKGDDIIDGGDGDDVLLGGKGDDELDGGAGNDLILAGSGDDTVTYDVDENGSAQNWFDGGQGNDTLRLRVTQAQLNEMTSAGVLTAFALVAGTNQIFDFSTFGLSFDLNLSVARFEQLEFDVISTGPDPLFTENSDTVDFNAVVAGTYLAGTQYDGLGGDDTVTLASNAAAAAVAGFVVGTAFNAGEGNDTITGGALDDIINGDAGNDVLNGGTGIDILNGGADDDHLILEDANVGDTVDGGTGNDTFTYNGSSDGGINSMVLSANSLNVDGASISLTDIEQVEIFSGAGNDSLFVNVGGGLFDGQAGDRDQLRFTTLAATKHYCRSC